MSTSPEQAQQQQQEEKRSVNVNADPAQTDTGYIDPKAVLPEATIQQSNMEEYFSTAMKQLGDDYFRRVMELAASTDIFHIPLPVYDPSGRTLENPVTHEKEKVIVDWKPKAFKRYKITSKDFEQIDLARAEYNMSKDAKQISILMAQMYELIAFKYLRMSHEEYVSAQWEELRPVLDACNFRTVYSLPYAQKPSST